MADGSGEIVRRVRQAYSAAALAPARKHPFPVGRRFAESIGYPPELLDDLPSAAFDAFAGVSNVSVLADIPEGARVLDLGCGAGLDSLVAARRAGPLGLVVGVDFGGAMLDRARQASRQAGLGNVVLCQGDAGRLPLVDAFADIALANGIFNLNPDRRLIFEELARTVKVGGTVFAAELIARSPLPPAASPNARNWFA